MKYIKLAAQILFNPIRFGLKRIFGCRVSCINPNLIAMGATVRTAGRAAAISVGKRTGIRSGAELSATGGVIEIGDRCFINRNSMVVARERIQIGHDTTVGPNTCIYDHDHNAEGTGYITKPVTIGNHVWIGAGCIILKGVTIGDYAVIGAGTLVTHDVAPHTAVWDKRSPCVKTIGEKDS